MTTPAQPYTPTPALYGPGSIKQDTAVTLAVAVRTTIITANNAKDWLVATVDHGGHYAPWDDVSNWLDITTDVVLTAQFSGGGALTADVVSQLTSQRRKRK
jgi:hypothetical protein